MITLLIDGKPQAINDGARLTDILPGRDQACSVAIIRPGARESAVTGSMRLDTTAGEVVVDLNPDGRKLFDTPHLELPIEIHWQDRYAAAFGPFPSSFTPARAPALYERGDVILGCGGYDPERSYLIFSRSRHTSDLGAPAGGGVIGQVVSGRGIIDRWGTGDQIRTAAPIVSWADTSRSFTTNDPDLLLEDGMEIISFLRITSQGYSGNHIADISAAESVEHMLLALADGHFMVERSASTHIRDNRKAGTDVQYEVKLPRREGAVTMRTSGRSRGALFIYIQDLPGSTTHTITGQVTHGLELARLAKEGEILCVQVDPPRFDLIGVPVERALEIASSRGVRVKGNIEDSSLVVVEQEPPTTLQSLFSKEVTVGVVSLEQVIDIELDDTAAPDSCDIFRRLTGLNLHDVGRIPFFFTFDDVFLFKPKIPKGVNINPENTPIDHVSAGILAITNDSRKSAGLVGVRTTDNSEFGPTSEPFESTNIIGKVRDLDKLPLLKEKEIVFIREVKS
jgi:putative methanogenesis marker protein 3